MKRITILFLISLLVFSLQNLSYSADLVLGGKAFYANWDPYIKDIPGEYPLAKGQGWELIETGGGWMYGPSAGLSLMDKISLSVSYMYGNLLSKFDGISSASGGGSNINSVACETSGYAEAERQDLDAALSFNINTFFKIFAGCKYQPIKLTVKQGQEPYVDFIVSPPDDAYYSYRKSKMVFESESTSPAVGIGYSQSFADIFAFTLNISALYLLGNMEVTRREIVFNNPPETHDAFRAEMDLSGWGFNAEPAILCILKENIIIQAGFRYQMLRINGDFKVKSGSGSEPDVTMDGLIDQVYGVTFTVLYRFGL